MNKIGFLFYGKILKFILLSGYPMINYNIIKNKNLLTVFSLSFFIVVLSGVLLTLKLSGLESPIIIHFDYYKNIDFLGDKIDAFGIIISAFAIILINLLLAEFLYYRDRFLSYLFGFFSLGFSILILIAVSVIININ